MGLKRGLANMFQYWAQMAPALGAEYDKQKKEAAQAAAELQAKKEFELWRQQQGLIGPSSVSETLAYMRMTPEQKEIFDRLQGSKARAAASVLGGLFGLGRAIPQPSTDVDVITVK